jgi:ParB family chromosome partitioning protein
MRLLNLPDSVKNYLADGKLTAGHARALIGHEDAQKIADHIVRSGLSVRDAERLAKQGLSRAKPTKPAKSNGSKDADTVQIESELTAALGMKVTIDHQPDSEGGKLSVSYKNLDQLDDLLRALSGS